MDRSLLILFGSETGCAQDVAENLARQARRRHFKTRVVAMDDYDKVMMTNTMQGSAVFMYAVESISRRKVGLFCMLNDWPGY